ncbi:hypothetical protein D7V91_03490 [bacterium 1xD42-67]|nr:hypothetical protein D7V91_03490 [bacterium 1xD42-67]
MDLIGEKVDRQNYFSVGYDNISKSYILEQIITYVGCFSRYFKISKEQYEWFESHRDHLTALSDDFFTQNIRHPQFFFSEYPIENTDEQNKLLSVYEKSILTQNTPLVLKNKILDLQREIDKAERLVNTQRAMDLNQCRIRLEVMLQRLSDGSLSGWGEDLTGVIRKIKSLSATTGLCHSAAELEKFYHHVWYKE